MSRGPIRSASSIEYAGLAILYGTLYIDPTTRAFTSLARLDPPLSRLTKQGAAGEGKPARLFTSVGQGTTVQIDLLAGMLIRSAWIRCLLQGRTSLADLVGGLHEVLSESRRLLAGETVDIPALQAFAFVTLPPTRVLRAPWGVLRSPSAYETTFGSRLMPGSRSHTDDQGTLVVQYSGDLVLETRVALTMQVSDDPLDSPVGPTKFETWEEMHRRQILVSLAVTLAVERTVPAVAIPTWSTVLDPLSFGSSSYPAVPPSLSSSSPIALTVDEATAVEAWLNTVESAHSTHTTMAARRIQSSIAERRDAGDGLVDAVVAWESLFGSQEGETTLRVSASIARLLGTDLASRQAIQREAKKIYGLRSRLVHGGAPVDSTAAYDGWIRASTLGIQALRKLYGDRPDLLKLEPTERSLKILLGD